MPVEFPSLDVQMMVHLNLEVTELMSAAKKPKSKPSSTSYAAPINKIRRWDPRDGLGVYLEDPESHPEVVEHDDDFVVIHDRYPKASVHLLLLPRHPDLQFQHPLKALSTNPGLLAAVQEKVEHLKGLVAKELRRMYGQYSASDEPYQSALENLMSNPDPPSDLELSKRDLPVGRDWALDVIAGAHTHPSMNHMHFHILSRDMHSECLKHKKHYLSFNSSFLVPLEDFPLKEGSERFHPGDWPNREMKCWRCGRNYHQRFAQLKRHLEEEFEGWKRE